MDVHHLMTRCVAWQQEPTVLRREYETRVGRWPSTVTQLLESRKLNPVVLEFLATIPAGKRLRVKEPEQEE